MIQKEPTVQAQKIFFGLIFIFIIYLLYLIAQPILTPLIFGAILAGTVYPLHKKLKQQFQLTNNFAALLTSLITTVVIIIPCIFIGFRISQEAFNFYDKIKIFIESDQLIKLYNSDNFFITTIKDTLTAFNFDLSWEAVKSNVLEVSKDFSGTILKTLNNILGNLLSFLFDFTIAILSLYTLFSNGGKLKEFLFHLSPLSAQDEELLLDRFNQMNYVSIICNGIGGVIQGGLAGLLFYILGLDSPFLWTAVMVILAFIPLLGISLVTVPASVFLILSGSEGTGLFLFISSLIIGFLTENWFKPKFIGNRIKINSLFVLFTTIGGIKCFGIAGIFYGPLIGILFLTMVTIYHQKYTTKVS